jgi:hypothetical protein
VTVLLRWLIENAWIFYVACGVLALIDFVRALTAHRERGLALFTLERESATARVVQSWSTVLAFIVLAAILYVATHYVIPEVPLLDPEVPLPTPTLVSGVEPITPSPGPSPTGQLILNTPQSGTAESQAEPTATFPPPPTAPPSDESTPEGEPKENPTPAPTQVTVQSVSGDLNVRFGDFARLAGYTVSTVQPASGTTLELTLYWQALDAKSPVDYIVFTHLLADDGHLVAQHDGQPEGGNKPTTSWAPRESIVDYHPMTFQDLEYKGTARIVVGLYAATGERVIAGTGADHAILPIAINVVAP